MVATSTGEILPEPHWNRMIRGWDIEILTIFKMMAVRRLRNLQFRSTMLFLSLILILRSKFRVVQTVWRWDIAPKQCSMWRPCGPPFWICKMLNFLSREYAWKQGVYLSHQIWSKFDDSRLIYRYMTIFKMAAVCLLNFRTLLLCCSRDQSVSNSAL